MKYDFDSIIDRRNTNAENVEGFREYIFGDGEIELPYADDEFIRMWVADMEFAVAPEIRQAIKDRTDKLILGYTMDYDPEYYQALDQWCRRRFDWSFPKEQLCYSPGIVPALYRLTGHLVTEEEKVLIVTPSYGPFRNATRFNHCGLVCSPLKYEEGRFSIDFDDFAAKAADPAVKLVIWCNPHNPSGRVWTTEELSRVAQIVQENNLWIISDEIHCDLLRQGIKHTPMGKIMPDYERLVTCMANSKTFNIAGLMMSHIIIRDEKLREQFKTRDNTSGNLNPAVHRGQQGGAPVWRGMARSAAGLSGRQLPFCRSILKRKFTGCGIPYSGCHLSGLGRSEPLSAGCRGSSAVLCQRGRRSAGRWRPAVCRQCRRLCTPESGYAENLTGGRFAPHSGSRKESPLRRYRAGVYV